MENLNILIIHKKIDNLKFTNMKIIEEQKEQKTKRKTVKTVELKRIHDEIISLIDETLIVNYDEIRKLEDEARNISYKLLLNDIKNPVIGVI